MGTNEFNKLSAYVFYLGFKNRNHNRDLSKDFTATSVSSFFCICPNLKQFFFFLNELAFFVFLEYHIEIGGGW